MLPKVSNPVGYELDRASSSAIHKIAALYPLVPGFVEVGYCIVGWALRVCCGGHASRNAKCVQLARARPDQPSRFRFGFASRVTIAIALTQSRTAVANEIHRLNPYVSQFEAQVVSISRNYVVLNQTCFRAPSETVAGDRGELGGIEIVGVGYRSDGETLHLFADETETVALAVGDVVEARVDWARRLDVMRLHTAAQLVVGGVSETFGLNAKMHRVMTHRSEVTVEVTNCEPVDIDVVWWWLNDVIEEDLPISRVQDPASGRDYWLIDGMSRFPNTAPYVRSTGEIGSIELSVQSIEDNSIAIACEVL